MTQEKKLRQKLETAQPMWKIVLTQFVEHKLAVVGVFIISLFLLIALSAPLIATLTGHTPERQNLMQRFKPPFTRVQLSAPQKEQLTQNFVDQNPTHANLLAIEIVKHKSFVGVPLEDALFELSAQTPTQIAQILTELQQSESLEKYKYLTQQFNSFHILGTDELGRDVLIRLVYGTRVSISVGILVAVASALIGLIIGCLAGFYGGLIDMALMRITDTLLSLPHVPVLVLFAAIDITKIPGLNLILRGQDAVASPESAGTFLSFDISQQQQALIKLVVILCLFSWMTVARLVRSSVLSLKEREFILAARTLGASDFTILFRHVMPNVIAPLLVSVTLGVGESILFESALSFLGMGIQPPMPSWGNMLNNAQELITEAPMLAMLPGLLILFTTISFNYVGDGLQDAVDPKAIRR